MKYRFQISLPKRFQAGQPPVILSAICNVEEPDMSPQEFLQYFRDVLSEALERSRTGREILRICDGQVTVYTLRQMILPMLPGSVMGQVFANNGISDIAVSQPTDTDLDDHSNLYEPTLPPTTTEEEAA